MLVPVLVYEFFAAWNSLTRAVKFIVWNMRLIDAKIRINGWRNTMSEVFYDAAGNVIEGLDLVIPEARNIFGLHNRKVDKNSAANGIWCEMPGVEGEYRIEFRVRHVDHAKGYNDALAEWNKVQEKKGKPITDLPLATVQKKLANLISEHLVAGWRTFIPKFDESGQPVYKEVPVDPDDPDCEETEMVVEGGYINKISDGEKTIGFTPANCAVALLNDSEWLTAIRNASGDRSQYTVEKAADKSSFAA